MSIPKQAGVNLSKPTGYQHHLRIEWAGEKLSMNKTTWEIGFTYGIFPLTKGSFTGSCIVYLDGGRLWIRNIDFNKVGSELNLVLQNGVDDALKELDAEAVRVVMGLASMRVASTSGPTKNLATSGSPHVKRMANGMQLRVRLPTYHPSDWDTLLEKPLQQKFSRPEYKLLVLGSAGDVPYLRVIPASGVEEDVFLRAVKKDINALIREVVKLHNEKGSDIQLFSLVREVGSDNRDLIRALSDLT